MKQKDSFGKKPKRSFWRTANKSVEVRYALLGGWLAVVGLLSGGILTYFIIWNNLIMLPLTSHPEEIILLHARVLKMMGLLFGLFGVVGVLLAAILQFRIIHRLSGPIYRLEKALLKLAEGELPRQPVILREKDLTGGLAKAFNRLVDAIRSGQKFQ